MTCVFSLGKYVYWGVVTHALTRATPSYRPIPTCRLSLSESATSSTDFMLMVDCLNETCLIFDIYMQISIYTQIHSADRERPTLAVSGLLRRTWLDMCILNGHFKFQVLLPPNCLFELLHQHK